MHRDDIRIRSSEGGEFACYLAGPDGEAKVPAIVLAATIYGVDRDIRDLADEFAGHGYLAAAPDLFWRSIPGPLPPDDPRAAERSQPRLDRISAGEADLVDALAELRRRPRFNGRAAVIGFCYGGPYAVIGPARLGFDAGISCHGSQMGSYAAELERVTSRVCILWGDRDGAAPPPVVEQYRALASRMSNVDLQIFPGVEHGYMMPGDGDAFDQPARDVSMELTLGILAGLRGDG